MFNDPRWARVLENAYGMKSERVHGVLLFDLRAGLEMNPVGDYLDLPNPEFFAEVRGLLRVDGKPNLGDGAGWFTDQNLETYRLKVGNSFEELLKKKIHQKTRNLILKAEKMGLSTRLARDEADFWAYYKVYVKTMLGIGSIPQSFVLFQNLWREFGPDLVHVFLTEKDHRQGGAGGRILSGIVTLKDRSKKRLHIWSNAQTLAARPLSANMETYAAVLRFACEDPEIEEVDFGNSTPESSLAFFKSRFGAEKVPVWTVSPRPITNRERKLSALKFLTWVPAFIVSGASRLLFKFLR